MCSDLNCYKFKTTVVCKPHGNHKAKSIVDTQKIKKYKHTTENHQITKEKEGKQRHYKTTQWLQ